MNQDKTIHEVLLAYRRFKNWAEEFEHADMAQKTMIAYQLFDRIKIGKGYKFHIQMNVTYKLFCGRIEKTVSIMELTG